jgi:hypothetical protein
MKEILVSDICRKRNCYQDHTKDGRHKIKINIEV